MPTHVVKTRPMIARELVQALDGEPWEVQQLRRLSRSTLEQLARAHIPDYDPVAHA